MKNPTIIVISGLPGVGKSTLAEDVARKLQIPIFSVDPIESSLIKSGIEKSFETGLAAYVVAQTLASEQLKLGMSLIIDAVSPVKEARDMWHTLEKTCHAKLVIIECVLEDGLHKKRVENRIRNIHGLPEVTWENVEKCRKEFVVWTEKKLIIDTAKDKEFNALQAVEYITSIRG